MTIETTLQKMFDEYPDLFITRKECYNHLFCTIGNGYEWRRGQIVEYVGPNEHLNEMLLKESLDYEESPKHQRAHQSAENIRKTKSERRHMIKSGFATKEDFTQWYPICKYSLIKNIPEDVMPDWKAAIEECKKMLKKDGIDIDKE